MNEFLDNALMAAVMLLRSVQVHMQQPYAWIELFSAASGLLGSLVLALKGKYFGWGWVLFALSNAGWIVFASGYGHWFLLCQQIGFSITSAIGIWQYLVAPRVDSLFDIFSPTHLKS